MQGKVTSETSANPTVHVGIDVCKVRLDLHITGTGRDVALEFGNDKKGMKELIKSLAAYRVAGVVMEATGKFHRAAHRRLDEAGYRVSVVNPLRARLFAESIGLIAKTDKVDARGLALFGRAAVLKEAKPLPQTFEAMTDIVRARDAAVIQRTALVNQAKAATHPLIKTQIRLLIKAVGGMIKTFDKEAYGIAKGDPVLARRVEVLQSVPGIGRVTAVMLVATLPELGHANSKQIAMLVGVAPVARESGGTKGRSQIKGGRAHVRAGLYMPTLSAISWNEDLKRTYEQHVAAGKVNMVAIVAVMRKLVVLANSLLKEDRLWSRERPIAKPLLS
jgi:transposase